VSKLPQHWIMTSFGSICGNGQYGWTTKAENQGTIKFLRTTDITKDRINWNTVPYCHDIPTDIDKYQVQLNDILISRAGSVGFSTLINHVPFTTIFASYLIRFVPSKNIEPRYIAHFLRSSEYWQQISETSAGIALSNVNATNLSKISIPLAPLNEQKRIADKLDDFLARVDACRDRLDHVSLTLKRFRQSVLSAATSGELTKDWRTEYENLDIDSEIEDASTEFSFTDASCFGDFRFPICWTMTRLGEIAEISGGITKDSKKQNPADEELPYLRVANVQRGYFDLGEIKTIRVPQKRVDELLLKSGDILFNEGGDLDKLGRGWVWNEEIERCTFQNHVFRVRLHDELFAPKFFSWYGNLRGADYFLSVGKQTTNLASINKSLLSALPVVVPPAPEQQEIVRRVEGLFAYADSIEALYQNACDQIERLIPALLDKAFRGELVEQDPTDEPASILLERIRTERSAQPIKPRRILTNRKPTMTKISTESVKVMIDQFPMDTFSFADLRKDIPGDYDSVKDILFTLLDEAEPVIRQVFDEKEKTMHFVRGNK
jgi:type I restriction enzyme, S subunit